MRTTRTALYGLLGISIAWIGLRIVRILVMPELRGDVQIEDIAMVMMVFAAIGMAFSVAQIGLVIVYAHSLRGTVAAGLAQAAWIVAATQLVVSQGLSMATNLVAPELYEWMILPGAVLGWVYVGLLAGSAVRLFRDTGNPLSLGYVYALVGIRVVGHAFGTLQGMWIRDRLGEPGRLQDSALSTVFEVLSWGLWLAGVAIFAAFVFAVLKRLEALRGAEARVFD